MIGLHDKEGEWDSIRSTYYDKTRLINNVDPNDEHTNKTKIIISTYKWIGILILIGYLIKIPSYCD